MGIEGKTIRHKDYLEVIILGTYVTQEALDMFIDAIETCRQTEISKIIIDFSELIGGQEPVEKCFYAYNVVKHYEQYLSSGGQAINIAYLGKPSYLNQYDPALEIAQHAGLPFRLFGTKDDALEFLGVLPPLTP